MRVQWDLEAVPLEVRTNSVLGSGYKVQVTFYSAKGQYAGAVRLNFGSTLQYDLPACESWTNFPVTPPDSRTDKVWRITLTRTAGVRLVIHCNGVEVLNKLLSDTTCSYSKWSKYWNKDVTKIEFPFYDTASNYYRPGK